MYSIKVFSLVYNENDTQLVLVGIVSILNYFRFVLKGQIYESLQNKDGHDYLILRS